MLLYYFRSALGYICPLSQFPKYFNRILNIYTKNKNWSFVRHISTLWFATNIFKLVVIVHCEKKIEKQKKVLSLNNIWKFIETSEKIYVNRSKTVYKSEIVTKTYKLQWI